MPRHIVIVEDEYAIAQNYCDALTRHGFKVTHYQTLSTAQEALSDNLPDLAIIDVGLGDDIDGGFELCRTLRQLSSDLPIIFLSARDDDIDIVSGLRLGADDYLTKNISMVHMLARITALFRRIDNLQKPDSTQSELKQGNLKLNMDRMTASWRELGIDLTITEIWIVHCLARHPGQVKNRQQLMDAASVVLDDSTITSHIKRIRKKFREADNVFDAIQAVYGLGYRWQPE